MLQILYGLGFSEEDLKATVPVIFSNVISSMQALVKATKDFSLPVAATVRGVHWRCALACWPPHMHSLNCHVLVHPRAPHASFLARVLATALSG